MYHRIRRKWQWQIMYSAVFTLHLTIFVNAKMIPVQTTDKNSQDYFTDNDISDFDDEYKIKFKNHYGDDANWSDSDSFNKDSHKYTLVNNKLDIRKNIEKEIKSTKFVDALTTELNPHSTTEMDLSVIPLELVSTTENILSSLIDSTYEPELAILPMHTTTNIPPDIKIEEEETPSLPTSTESDISTTEQDYLTTTDIDNETTTNLPIEYTTRINDNNTQTNETLDQNKIKPTKNKNNTSDNKEQFDVLSTEQIVTVNSHRMDEDVSTEDDNPVYTELDERDKSEVPDDYYDSKDPLPTKAPNTDALSVIFGLAGSVVESVVESVAERVVPKGIYDLFKRMQRQNEALEAERLRSREENGGLGQFGRGILKTISSGLSKPFTQLMAGARDIGSLDNDRSFVTSLASGVTSVANVANSLADAFKDRVQAIYPGTVWCGDGRSSNARSSDLGLFFFTDTCCRQHDACKLYITAGDTKYGLTNTGLFTRSHCSCDTQFKECLKKTNSLVSAQIGLTYFNVLGPQCFRRAHPIQRCVRRTRLTGQKCEEYELDYTKPKMWQWFDNETF